MKLFEVTTMTLKPDVQKKAEKTLKAVKKEMTRYGKCDVELKPLSEVQCEIMVDFHRYMHPEDIDQAYDDFKDAIKRSDAEGHIFKIEDGNGVGSQFAEALLTGLRPGMVVKAEALFPTLAYEITWKNIVSRKG